MSRLARRLAQALFFPSHLPARRRLDPAPHGIVLLLAVAALFSSGILPGSAGPGEPSYASASAECAVLQRFFESPHLIADFEGTPDEMQRWVDAYDQHCR